jgi:hypothetical protein
MTLQASDPSPSLAIHFGPVPILEGDIIDIMGRSDERVVRQGSTALSSHVPTSPREPLLHHILILVQCTALLL